MVNKKLYAACGLAVMLVLASSGCSRSAGTPETLPPRTVVTVL